MEKQLAGPNAGSSLRRDFVAARLGYTALRYDAESYAMVTNLTARAGAWLLTGTIDVTPYKMPVEAFNTSTITPGSSPARWPISSASMPIR